MMTQMKSDEKSVFKIGEACRAAGIQPYVLRYWETEFPLLANRSGGAARNYTREEVDLICRIKTLLYEEGYTIAGARKKLEIEPAAGEHEPPRSGPVEVATSTHPLLPQPGRNPDPPSQEELAAPASIPRPRSKRKPVEPPVSFDRPTVSGLNAGRAEIDAVLETLDSVVSLLGKPPND